MYIPIITSIIDGVGSYFKTQQEIKKVKVEATKKVLVAEAEAKIKRLEKESEQDFNLDFQAIRNMEKSFKDELILIVFLVPMILAFYKPLADDILKGFDVIKQMPDWYQYIIIGMVVVIFGMRGLLKAVLSGKFKK